MKCFTKFKFFLAIALSFLFFVFDFYVGTNVVVFHLGPMIVSILFVSIITDLIERDSPQKGDRAR